MRGGRGEGGGREWGIGSESEGRERGGGREGEEGSSWACVYAYMCVSILKRER